MKLLGKHCSMAEAVYISCAQRANAVGYLSFVMFESLCNFCVLGTVEIRYINNYVGAFPLCHLQDLKCSCINSDIIISPH